MKTTSRRKFLGNSIGLSLGFNMMKGFDAEAACSARGREESHPTLNPLPGTRALTVTTDSAAQMVEGIREYLIQATADCLGGRSRLWKRDFTSTRAYQDSIAPNRERLRKIIGAVDSRVPTPALQIVAVSPTSAEVAHATRYKAYAVRWEVCKAAASDYPLEGEGLLLEPAGRARARVVAVPDADWTPEAAVGLAPGVPPAAQFPRRLAESGCQVIVPVLIDRSDKWSGIAGIKMTNQPHREWLYRMAFEVGRHIIGFEVQKILAAVDWFENENKSHPLPVGVFGYGEGGLLTHYAAALDPRIRAAGVSGYLQCRQQLWKEPIYRDIWGLLREFGDAEIAGLIAPRGLVVEACVGPVVDGPPAAKEDRANAACPNGTLRIPRLDGVSGEVARAREIFARLNAGAQLQLAVSDGGNGQPGSESALTAFQSTLGVKPALDQSGQRSAELIRDLRGMYDPEPRWHRQFDQMVGFTQGLVRLAPRRPRVGVWLFSCRAEKLVHTQDCQITKLTLQLLEQIAPSNPKHTRTSGGAIYLLLVPAALLLAGASALAQNNYEIQVYGSDTVEPHHTMVESHTNNTVEGSIGIVDGVLPTNGAWHETIEITHGFTDVFETGLYIFTSVNHGYGWQFVGTHIRPRVRAPERWHWPVGVSLSLEFGYQRAIFAADQWTLEIRPIIDQKRGRWYWAFNPALDRSFHGQSVNKGVEFAPSFKLSYDVTPKVAGGFEYYSSLGSLAGFDPLKSQQHQLFPVIDLNLSPKWEFNFGVGFGLTSSTDHLIVKMILGYRFDF